MHQVNVLWVPMPPDTLGQTDGHHTIWMNDRQKQAERRCTIAHELAHIELGHRNGCTGAEEREAASLAARRLIPTPALADALVWSQRVEVLADTLWVDYDTVEWRLATLRRDERAAIRERLAACEDGA